MLFMARPPRFLARLGHVGEEDITGQREWQGDDTIDNEEPAPCHRQLLEQSTWESKKQHDLQPEIPFVPSKFVYAAAWRKPLNRVPIEPASQKTIARLPISRGVYHDPSR